jgi:hypothetical protein
MAVTTKASTDVIELLEKVKSKHHTRLGDVQIAVCLSDTKPFKKDRFNWGKVSKFSEFNRLWQKKKYDFCIEISVDVWYQILDEGQREALLDLHLTRCTADYEPAVQVINGKKVAIKDEWGRVQYSDQFKYDDEGNPKWKVDPLDLEVFASNFSRYGLWCEHFESLKKAVTTTEVEEKILASA